MMYPAPTAKQPLPNVLENTELDERLRRAYASAVQVLNTGEWNATAVMCRRLLEGILASVLPPDVRSKTLAVQLECLPQYRDLGRPFVDLSHAIRKGGNLGAHFIEDREPDERVARLMLELCEDLLEYLFTLPLRIQDLQAQVELLGRKQATSGDGRAEDGRESA